MEMLHRLKALIQVKEEVIAAVVVPVVDIEETDLMGSTPSGEIKRLKEMYPRLMRARLKKDLRESITKPEKAKREEIDLHTSPKRTIKMIMERPI